MLGLGRRTIACSQCATETDRSAVWCGWCGARLVPGEPVEEPADGQDRPVDEPPPGPDRRSGRVLRGVALVGVVALLAVVVVAARPAPVAESLVGRLDLGSGPSATLPPAPGLEVAWRQPTRMPGEESWFVGASGQPVAHAGRAVVGGVVVDLASGALVGDLRTAPLYGTWGPDGQAATLRGGVLEVADVVTGEVVSRARTDEALQTDDAPGLESWPAARGQDTTLFSARGSTPADPHGVGTWVLVADDGAVVASGPGDAHAWSWVRARSTTHAVVSLPLEPGSTDPDDGTGGRSPQQWSVIDLGTGREVLRTAPHGEWWQPPQLAGGHLFVVEGPGEPDAGGPDRVWDVTLHDLATSRVVWSAELASEEPPTLHAVTDDGRGVVARRVRSALQVDVVDEAGPRGLTTLASPAATVWSEGPPSASQVAASGDVVVLLDAGADALVATDLDGQRRWRTGVGPLPEEGWVRLDVVGDLVVLAADGGDGPQVSLVDLDDGRLVHRVTPGMPMHLGLPAPTVHATVDGLVAVGTEGHAPWEPAPSLSAMDWFDVRHGRQRALEEVAGRWLRGVDVPEGMRRADGSLDTSGFLRARLSGTVQGEDGRVRPLVVWPEDDGHLELMVGGEVPTHVDLPAAASGRQRDHDVVAVAGSVLVVRASDSDGRPLTVLVDRASRRSTVLPSVRPMGVADGVVVGLHEPEVGRAEVVAHELDGGDVRWRAPWTWGDALATDDEQVVVLRGAVLTARRPADGTVVWRRELGRLVTERVVLTERSVLLHTPHGEVLAVDRDDGTVRWRRHVGGLVTAVGAAGGHALVGTRGGTVVQLDAAGQEVQRITVGASPVSAVASVGPTVVAVVGDEVVGLHPEGTGIARQDEVPLP